jgi:hypothetical protein
MVFQKQWLQAKFESYFTEPKSLGKYHKILSWIQDAQSILLFLEFLVSGLASGLNLFHQRV